MNLRTRNAANVALAMLMFTSINSHAQAGFGEFENQDLDDQDPASQAIARLQAQEEIGVTLFRSGDFDRAYEVLSETARHGFKDSQHAMALMYLRGQGVERHPLKGAALLGLAAESGDKTRKREYEKALLAIPEQYREVVQQQVDFYVGRYGMQAQGITCSMKKRPQSNLRAMECLKAPGVYDEYPWDP